MSHHSVKALTIFLDRHGMELTDVERVPIQHGSLIGTVQLKGGKHKIKKSVRDLLELESKRRLDKLDTLTKFGARVHEQKERTRKLVQDWRRAKLSIAGYGAARSGPTLISQLGLTGAIDYIVDDHPQKVGKYSSGDGIKILPTSELCKRMPAYTVILAWVHAQKIIDTNREYLDKGGHFVVLCPETRVVGRDGEVTV